MHMAAAIGQENTIFEINIEFKSSNMRLVATLSGHVVKGGTNSAL